MRTVACVLLIVASTAEAAPYDRLFDTTSAWTYSEKRRVWFGDEKPQNTREETVTVTCKVTAVKRVAGADVSTVECDKVPWGTIGVDGTWVRTTRGLRRANDVTKAEVRRALREPVLISAKPRVKVGKAPSEDYVGSVYSVELDAQKQWCAIEDYGDPGGGFSTRTCFANGAIVSQVTDGNTWGDGGAGSKTTTTLVP